MTQVLNPVSRPFWEGCEAGVLRLQRCRTCHRPWFYPRPFCPHCLSDAFEWVGASGQGSVYSFSVVRRGPSPAFTPPFVLALIELKEGVRLLSWIVECAAEDVRVGMPVSVTFGPSPLGLTVPLFRPAAADNA